MFFSLQCHKKDKCFILILQQKKDNKVFMTVSLLYKDKLILNLSWKDKTLNVKSQTSDKHNVGLDK